MSVKRIRLEKRPDKKSSGDYEIGKGKPPKEHQFKPGHSGNPKGRPKGSRNFATDVKAMLKEPVRVSRDGKPRNVSTQAASLMRLREQALGGNVRALDRLLNLAASFNNEQLSAAAMSMSADDEALFNVLVSRLRSGAIARNIATAENGETAASSSDGDKIHKDGEKQ